jgi:hypothetical protein
MILDQFHLALTSDFSFLISVTLVALIFAHPLNAPFRPGINNMDLSADKRWFLEEAEVFVSEPCCINQDFSDSLKLLDLPRKTDK